MSLFQQIGDPSESTLRPWIPAVGCLLAAGCAAMLSRPAPRFGGFIPLEVGAWAIGYVAIAFFAAALTAWAAFTAFRPRTGIDVAAVVLVFAAAAAWFAPTIIFVSHGYVWSIAVAGVLAAGLARLLRRYKRVAIVGQRRQPRRVAHTMFHATVRNTPPARRLRTLCAALSAQAGVIAAVMGNTGLAAYFIAISCFMVAWWMAASDLHTRGSLEFRRSGIRVAANVLLAIQFTALGLMPYISGAQALTKTNKKQNTNEANAPPAEEDRYSGIILLPVVQRHVTIVPPLPALRRQLFHAGAKLPLSVPFSGEYWFFYSPLRRPPRNSMVAHGTPTDFKFTAAGRTPLIMQGRQSFGTPIDPRCCSRIELAISNTDPMPGTIGVEVVLVNTALPGRPSEALPEVMIMSALPLTVNENTPPAKEMLRFEMPARPALSVFDEMVVIFHLREPRKSRSANVSIDRFSFVPRGD